MGCGRLNGEGGRDRRNNQYRLKNTIMPSAGKTTIQPIAESTPEKIVTRQPKRLPRLPTTALDNVRPRPRTRSREARAPTTAPRNAERRSTSIDTRSPEPYECGVVFGRKRGRNYRVSCRQRQRAPEERPRCEFKQKEIYGTSISSIFPSLRRCSTLALPLGSRNTNTSRSRNSHSFTASSMVMGRIATESVACTR